MQQSWKLAPSSTTIRPKSPRRLADGPTYTLRPTITSPISVADGCTNADGSTTGVMPSIVQTFTMASGYT